MSPSISDSTTPRLLHEAVLAQMDMLYNEPPVTSPSAETTDLDELKTLCNSFKVHMSAMAGLVGMMEIKIQNIEKRQSEQSNRQQEMASMAYGEPSTSKPMTHVQAWLKDTEQVQPASKAGQVVAPPTVRTMPDAPRASDTFSEHTVQVARKDPEEEYLDRFFPDRVDLPCRLLLGIMEHIYLKIEKQLSSAAKEDASHWRTHLKEAIQSIVVRYNFPMPKRETRGFKLVANALTVRSDEEVRPLSPATLYDMMAIDDARFVRPVLNITLDILRNLRRVAEILPPIFRGILEDLATENGRLYLDDRLWDIELTALAQRVSQLVRGFDGDAYEVCNELCPHVTGQYVRDRLHGATVDKALNDMRQRRRRQARN